MNMLFDFSSALLQARQRKGVTQEQIAFSLNISQATYNAWGCGHRLCPYKHIVALISYFDDEGCADRVTVNMVGCFGFCCLCSTTWQD